MKEEKKEEKSGATEREERILKFWQERDVFQKTEGRNNDNFIFYDGPPFANGEPHYGHILASTIKDIIPRYQVMRGRRLRRRWGWDCHGLPVENLTEKELGLKGKKEIEEYGIEKFNEATRINIMRDASVWERQIPRMGRFVDMENDYKTMDPPYTESVWWAFKTLYEKSLIYKGFKSMHLCPRCGTTLSNFEVNLGYTDITDIAITVPFLLKDEPDTYLLAWTTTPWTLPGNMALAVNENIEYISFSLEEDKSKKYIVAKERLENILKEKKYTTLELYKGKDLVGKSYEPLFPYYKEEEFAHKENVWRVYAGDFVTTEDGTGIVHIAPAFGEDDLKLAQKNNIPIEHHVGMDGKFKKEVTDFRGLFVKPKDDKGEGIDHSDTDVEIIKYLAHNGKLFAKEKITHSYPLCWRCDTPLLNYATDSWFVKVTDIKNKLVEENNKIHWVPENIGKYRFGNWLEGAHDWAISRSRYWGAPIPVWENADKKERLILSSLEDFRKHVKKSGNTYFLMRHGEAESNVKSFTSSNYRDKVHITEKGKEEIKISAEKIRNEKVDFIFASDFLRTKETAEFLAKEIDFPKDKIIFDKRLREIDTGDFAGKSNGDYHAYFVSILEKFTKRPPNGENLNDLKCRVMEFVYEIEEKYQDKKILIITHEYAVWMLSTGAFGWSDRESAMDKEKKEDFIKTGEIIDFPFVPLPHNRNFELDFHRPYIDEVKILSTNGEEMRRVPDVFDCWFESGSMPYAQDHYPFKKELYDPEKNIGYPADFIAEGLDQTRGWFYSLLVLGVALFGRAPYKNVIVNGLILAEDGQKMSKRLKNYPDPMEVIGKYGADALRYYLLSSPVVRGEELRFSERAVGEIASKLVGRFINVLSFFLMYTSKEEIDFATLQKNAKESANILDQWILQRLAEVHMEVTKGMEKYELDSATRPLMKFVDDLSTWYLRRSRERFKSDDDKDRKRALSTTQYVLLQTSKILAPIMPFVAEDVYQKIKTKDGLESVHFESWIRSEEENKDEIISLMEKTREIVSAGLLERAKANIKVKQPLSLIKIKDLSLMGKTDYLGLIKDELNVKEVSFDEKSNSSLTLDINVTEELKEEGEVREIIRAIQEKRKELNLLPIDKISIMLHLNNYARNIESYRERIILAVNASSLQIGQGELGGEKGDFLVEVKKD